MIKSIALAFSFLTILPVLGERAREATPRELAASFSAFPIVGAVLGFIMSASAFLLSNLVPPPILAVLLTLCLAVLTRFLHLDGLADLADGLWGGYTIERRLEIMRDSRTGSFGAAALSLILLLKSASFFILLTQQVWPVLFMSPLFSRFAMVVAAHGSPYARKEGGLAESFLTHMTTKDLLTAASISIALSLHISILHTAILMTAAAAAAWTVKAVALRMLGGITGDVLGAINEITEAFVLALGAILAHNLS